MKRLVRLLMLLLCGVLLSCEHKDLCYDHDMHTERVELKFNLDFDCQWEYNAEGYMDWAAEWPNRAFGVDYAALRPTEPDGVRLHAYHNGEMEDLRNMTKSKSSVRLANEGYYDFLFYNNDTEYIVFDGLSSFNTAYATTRSLVRSSYRGNSLMTRAGEEFTVNPPDMLYAAYIDSVYTTRSLRTDTLDVPLHPLVYTYLIRFEITKGAEHVAQAKGALAGMAQGVNLSDGSTTKDVATVLFDCNTVADFGVQAEVRSFGIPNYPNIRYTRSTEQFGLSIEMRLKNGNFQQHDFDITDQMLMQPHGGVIIITGIEIDETINEEGGFQIGVDGWGDPVDVPLPL